MFPSDPPAAGLAAHCLRVQTLAREMARVLGLPASEMEIVGEAARLHHEPALQLEPRALASLLQDLGRPGGASRLPSLRGLPAAVEAVLHHFHSREAGFRNPGRFVTLAQILELANLYDEQIEFLPFEERPADEILDELHWIAHDGHFEPAVMRSLRQLHRPEARDRAAREGHLPACPRAITDLLRTPPDPEPCVLESLANSDPALASALLRYANSSLFPAQGSRATAREAVQFIGTSPARRILLAASAGQLFAGAQLEQLWRHSLAAAETAAELARRTGVAATDMAFVAGLLHDVGRLALTKLRREDSESYTSLLEKGCPAVWCELLLFRSGHDELGGGLLDSWRVPEPVANAVRYHHRPGVGGEPLASLLYLTEFVLERDVETAEDIPSAARLNSALRSTGLSSEELFRFELPAHGNQYFAASA